MTGDDIATIVFLWVLPAILYGWVATIAWSALRMMVDPDYDGAPK